MLISFAFIVVAANVWVFSSSSELAASPDLRFTCLGMGVLYAFCIPLGLFLHGSSLISIRWNPSGLILTHWLTPWHADETAEWNTIRRITVNVGQDSFDDARLALASLKERIGGYWLFPIFPVRIALFCEADREIHVLSKMLTPGQALPFVTAMAQHLTSDSMLTASSNPRMQTDSTAASDSGDEDR